MGFLEKAGKMAMATMAVTIGDPATELFPAVRSLIENGLATPERVASLAGFDIAMIRDAGVKAPLIIMDKKEAKEQVKLFKAAEAFTLAAIADQQLGHTGQSRAKDQLWP
jgi:hypothetical protein